MIGYVLLWLIVGAAIGYMIAYSRFGNAKVVEELRTSYSQLDQDFVQQSEQMQEYALQNKILKSRAQQLLDQNEDYSKVISQLSRYYFRLKQANDKLKELHTLVSIVEEEDLAKKIDVLMTKDSSNGEWFEDALAQVSDKKFF